jgi:pimeloyl-ACP methyl ester carboxylesterase
MEMNYHQSAVTQFINANDTRYAYRTLGNKEGIPLLLFQHFTGTMENWDPDLLNGLAEHFKVIIFDNKGVGGSEGTTPDNISDMAKDADSFIDALGFKKVNLFGFSMGGFITQQIALNRPEIVNKMILAGTGPKGGEGITDIVNPLNVVSTMRPDESKLYLFYSPSESSRAIGKRIIEKMKERQTDRDPDASQEAIMAQLNAILSWGQPDNDFKEKLKKVNIPVFVVNGTNDIVVPTINSYHLVQYLPHARLSLYPDANHGAIFQYHDLFLEEAIPFLYR